MDITGPFHERSCAARWFGMQCINDFTRFGVIHFLKCESDATPALRHITTRISPSGLWIDIIGTDGGVEFDGHFQSFLHASTSLTSERLYT